MADVASDIAAINDRNTLEAYLRTRPLIEARALALRSAIRVMPVVTLAEMTSRKKTLTLVGFRALFFAWGATCYPASVAKIALAASRAASRARFSASRAGFVASASASRAAADAARAADESLDVALASRAASRAAFAASASGTRATTTSRNAFASRTGFIPDGIAEAAVWAVVRADLTSMRETSAAICLAQPLWPIGVAHELVEKWEVELSFALDTFGSNWRVVHDFHYALRKGRQPFAGQVDSIRAVTLALAEEEEAFWERDPDAVMRDLAERLGRGETPRQQEARSNAAPEKVDFFISYSTRNEAEAREINRYLEEAGYSTIVQFKDFPVGSNFVIEMQDGLERGARAIALLSPDYVASDHCRAGWAAVYNMDPLGKGRKLVPLLLKPANLNTLARQIIYKSLVGLNGEERRAAVLEAIGPGPDALAPDMLKRRLAETASPDVAPTPDGKLDAVPNTVYDRPVFDADLPDLPQTLRTLCSVIQASLPENSPKTIAPSLQAYGNHLSDRGVRPILGLLCMLADALNRDVRSVEFHVWGDGLAVHFDNFFSCHSKYVTHFPKSQEREEALATNEIDEDRASGKDFVEPVKKVVEALAELHEIGGTTPAFERVVQDSLQAAKDIDSLPTPPDAGRGGDITPKRRFVFSQIGFWERILSALGSMTTLATTEQGRAAIATLREAIAKFLSFLSSN